MFHNNAQYICYFVIDEKYADKVENTIGGTDIRINYPDATDIRLVDENNIFWHTGLFSGDTGSTR